MNEWLEFMERMENLLNRPFDILLIIAGLSFLLIAVLFRLSEIPNRIAHVAAIALGVMFLMGGATLRLIPLSPSEAPVEEGTHKLTNTQTQKLKNSKTQKLKNSKTQKLKNSKTQKLKNSKTQKLHYARVSRFEFVWNTGADPGVAFHRPLAPAGYHILGHHAQGAQGLPSGPAVAVRAASVYDDEAILAYPAKYERVWPDASAVGNETRGTIWRPIPPLGYRCMGDVATPGRLRPERKEVVCVRETLLAGGKPGARVWENRGSNAFCRITIVSVVPADPDEGVASNLFRGYRHPSSGKSGPPRFSVLTREPVAAGEGEGARGESEPTSAPTIRNGD